MLLQPSLLLKHEEVVIGWLEPLLDLIARDSRTVACPAIDTLHDETFQYVVAKKSGVPPVGGFSWYLQVGRTEHATVRRFYEYLGTDAGGGVHFYSFRPKSYLVHH